MDNRTERDGEAGGQSPAFAAAIRYVEHHGFSVIPIRPGASKKPAVELKTWAEYEERRPTLEELGRWFAHTDNNIGVITGAISGIIALDVDAHRGGEDAVKGIAFSRMPTQRTPHGGRHLIFAHPGHYVETRRDIAPGIDIRGDGGYIVAWPSVVDGVMYTFAPSLGLDDAPYGVPSQIPADWLNGHAGRPIPHELPEVIYDGEERWRHLASFAGTLRNRGFGETAIIEQLAVYNRRVCRPPKSDADVRRIARGVVEDLAPREASIDVVAAVTGAADEDAVFAVLTENEPPKLDKLERARLRDKLVRAAKGKLQSPAQVIDAWLSTPTVDDDGLQGMRFEPDSDPPWEDAVPGDEVLDETRAAITAYAHMGEYQAVAATLWTAYAHLYDCFGVCPNLQFWSPTWRCGKTSAAIPIKEMVRLGMFSSNITPAALFRSIDAWHPTLVIDEADSFVKMSDEIRGILNAGHTRATAFVIRAEGDANEPRMFSSWAPKLIAGIGHLPNTIEDRSIRARMTRKPVDVKTADAFDPDAVGKRCHPIRRRLARWGDDVQAEARRHDPERVAGVEHRDWNNWRPLLVIAELAGGDWPALARAAAKALSGADDIEEGLDELLLRHLREIFGDADALHTASIIKGLVDLEEGPWAKWWARDVEDGKTKAAGSKLARMLKPFGVKPSGQRIGETILKGYARADLEPVWTQYTRADTPSANVTDDTDVTPQVDEGASDQDRNVRNVRNVSTGGSAGGVFPEGDGAPEGDRCPDCGADSAEPGYPGHANNCPKFYAKEER